MKQIKETAYAKINLGLDILGKREDGYHEVSMIMQSVGLSDEVVIARVTAFRSAAICTTSVAVLTTWPTEQPHCSQVTAILFRTFTSP